MLESDNLYDFLCAMANFQAASWGLEYCSEEVYFANQEQLAQIKAYYQKKNYALHEWIEISFYGNCEEEVICVMGEEQILYASSSQTCFEAMNALVKQLELEAL